MTTPAAQHPCQNTARTQAGYVVLQQIAAFSSAICVLIEGDPDHARGAQVKALDHVQLVAAHVHKVLVQGEGVHVLGAEGVLGAVGPAPEVTLALRLSQGLPCRQQQQSSAVLAS